jgi:transcriptional regulator with XRE-family HTH domain
MSRPTRTLPKERAQNWPTEPAHDPAGEVARQVAINLRTAIGAQSLRHTAEITGIHHATILKIVNGTSWPDLETLAKLEIGLGVHLWPTGTLADH